MEFLDITVIAGGAELSNQISTLADLNPEPSIDHRAPRLITCV